MLCHLCRECGTDLADVRAVMEPHYGLFILRCPTCGSVAVRQRHPMLRRWQSLRRIDWALTVLAANLVALVALVAGVFGSAAWFAWEAANRTPVELWNRSGAAIIMCLFVVPLLTGTWLTAGLSHWRRPVAWIVFTALAATLLGFVTVVDILAEATPAGALMRLRLGLAALVLIMIVAMIGIGPGLGLLRALRAGRRAQWRWRRRRGRKERG